MFRIQIQLDYFLASVNIHALTVYFQLEEMDQERVIFSTVSCELVPQIKVQFKQYTLYPVLHVNVLWRQWWNTSSVKTMHFMPILSWNGLLGFCLS